MEEFIVYKHTAPNEKVYIGITSNNITERAGSNGINYRYNKHFYYAINKYGWDSFRHDVIYDELDKETACNYEIELIAKYKSYDRKYGYNKSLGGEMSAAYGIPLSEEHKQKISVSNKGRLVSESTKVKISKALTGIERADYIKLNKSRSMMGKNNHNYGKKFSDEHKQKISESNTGRIFTEEHKLKLSKSHKGQIPTKEQLRLAAEAKSIKVLQLGHNNTVMRTFESIADASRETNIDNSAISKVCKGKRKTAGGFGWKYKNK